MREMICALTGRTWADKTWNVDEDEVPCAPLGRGDMEWSYQGESFEDSSFAFTVVPVGDEEQKSRRTLLSGGFV